MGFLSLPHPPSPLQVIYALNTKNDEHEAAIATLKEAHEEEVQQILSETREKILQVYTLYFPSVSPARLTLKELSKLYHLSYLDFQSWSVFVDVRRSAIHGEESCLAYIWVGGRSEMAFI